MRSLWLGRGFVSIVLLWGAILPALAENFSYHHENVLGTSLEIQLEAKNSEVANRAEARILAEIDRLNAIFSSYNADSEFSRWQRNVGQSPAISPELYDVIRQCERWTEVSHGAFNPAVDRLSQVWRAAQQRDRLPEPSELTAAVTAIGKKHWTLTANSHATRLGDCSLSLNAIAKGTIVDAAGDVALRESGVQGVLVNIGGDLRVWGSCVRQVAIANPHRDAENASPDVSIVVRQRAVATSGNYRRDFKIEGKSYSHIIDPRSGQPADHVISATVVAPTTAEADALATIFSVLTPSESARLASALPQVDYRLVTRAGEVVESKQWNELAAPQRFRYIAAVDNEPAQEAVAAEEDADKADGPQPLELVVDFEINRAAGGRYRRPYVAIWLENKDEFPVKTALLWITTKDPGPRWHRDLLRWYRQDLLRKKTDDKALIGTIFAATRGPGEYKAVFDGLDDAGKPLPAGDYTLFIEVAREHGTYQLIRQSVTLGDKPFATTKLKTNVEVKSASIEYRKPSPKTDSKPAQ